MNADSEAYGLLETTGKTDRVGESTCRQLLSQRRGNVVISIAIMLPITGVVHSTTHAYEFCVHLRQQVAMEPVELIHHQCDGVKPTIVQSFA